jgi:hypothetical protein
MMSKTDGWYEGGTLVMRETYSYKDALDMAEFEELMSGVVESDVEELGVRNVMVHYQDLCVQVTARVDNPARTRYSPWQTC